MEQDGWGRPPRVEDWEDAYEVDGFEARAAAVDWLEGHFADMSYPKGPVYVLVKDDADVVVSVCLTIEYTPDFHGTTAVFDRPRECLHDLVARGHCVRCQREMGPGDR